MADSETQADRDARREWPAIDARNKIAFFCADLSRATAGAPMLTYTVCIPGAEMSPAGEAAVRQKMSELAAAIRDALALCGGGRTIGG